MTEELTSGAARCGSARLIEVLYLESYTGLDWSLEKSRTNPSAGSSLLDVFKVNKELSNPYGVITVAHGSF